MSGYTYGNLAVKQKQKEQRQYSPKQTATTRKAVISVREKLLYLFIVLLCVTISGVIISRYAQIYEYSYRINGIEQQINEIASENENLRLQIAELRAPERIMDIAMNQYGMKADEQRTEMISAMN